MDQTALRSLTSQLAEDLGWLEEHARKQPGHFLDAGRLRLAAGIVRNVLGPWLENKPTQPLHVVVVGGAGAGKSTIANMICGGAVAESNPQAGFTRHPVAYTLSAANVNWGDYLGFLGTLKRLTRPSPSSLDEDVYQVRRVGNESKDPSLLGPFVVWDCPDMTTWAATNYVPRLLEVAGLADVLVFVASDERYNDEVPTQFLKLFLEAGKPVVISLVKVRESDAAAFVEHYQKEVAATLPAKAAAVVTIPQLTPEQLQNPVEQSSQFRDRLVKELKPMGEAAEATRKKTVRAGIDYLKKHQNDLLAVAKNDLAALEAWRNLVQDGQMQFELRYRREYLLSEQFRRFDEALVRLLELLELPGVGKVVSGAMYVLRTPYRLIKGLFGRALKRPQAPPMPERPVLEGALAGWLDSLRKEAIKRSAQHPLWAHLARGFNTGLPEIARDRFEQGARGLQISIINEVDGTARGIYEDLEKHPAALNTLRGTKFAMELAAIGGSIALGGIGLLTIALVPIAASVTQHLVELLGKAYVDNQREQARARQQALVTQYLTGPMADWLSQWPTTGGSTYERLQIALRRIGPAITQLDAAIQT